MLLAHVVCSCTISARPFLVFFTETWKPDSFYDRIKENADLGMHTLVLLDIKVKEQSEENLARLVLALISRLGNLIIMQWA